MKTEEWPGLHHSCFPEVFSEMLGLWSESGLSDVLGLQKVLSKLGAYRFDVASGERSGEARPRLVQAIQRFQRDNDLRVDGSTLRSATEDGLINPAGPTIKALGKRVDEGPAGRPPPRPRAAEAAAASRPAPAPCPAAWSPAAGDNRRRACRP